MTAPPATDLERLAIDTVRTLSMDAVQAANSGHPGMPMAMAPLAYVLFRRVRIKQRKKMRAVSDHAARADMDGVNERAGIA